MIYGKRQDLCRYKGLYPSLDAAIDYLAGANLEELTPGRNEVDGENLFINRFDYATIPEEQASWEGHDRYGDLHIMISGRERIGVSDAGMLRRTGFQEASDFISYEGPVRTWYAMETEDVLIVFPEDVHMVKVALGEREPVSRAVFKFRL